MSIQSATPLKPLKKTFLWGMLERSMAEKTKILYLVTQSEWGGAQRYVLELAELMSNDFEVFVAAGGEKEGGFFQAPEILGKPQKIRLKNLVREISPCKDFLAFVEIRSLLKKIKPQILHTNSTKAGVLGALAAIGLGIKVVYTVHGWVFLEPLPYWKKWFYLICEKIACQFRHATILLSQKELEIAKLNKLNCGKSEIIRHGIDDGGPFLTKEEAQKQLSSLLRRPIGNATTWIGTIANLYESKDIPNLIEALKNINGDYAAIIIGWGHNPKIESLIKKENLSEKIFLTGGILGGSRFLKAFDLFVLPSAKEGFPYVILEAMSAGLPIVATSVGAIPEMITDKKSGLLVPPKNPEELGAKIETVMKNGDLRASLGREAETEFKQKFSKEKMAEKTKQLYNSLLKPF